jgi:hypothetical protein
MFKLNRKNDPTGVFGFLLALARDRYASPDGVIHSRGKVENGTQAGPGRRRLHIDNNRAGAKLAKKAVDTRASKYRGGVASRAYEAIQKAGRM